MAIKINESLPQREAFLFGILVTSASIIVAVNPQYIEEYFKLLFAVIGAVAGYATQSSVFKSLVQEHFRVISTLEKEDIVKNDKETNDK